MNAYLKIAIVAGLFAVNTGGLLVACGDGTPDGGDGAPRIVATFDGSMFQFPESLTLHGGDAFVSFINGHVMRVTAAGVKSEFGSVPITTTANAPDAYALGVASDTAGNIYLALVKASGTSPFPAGIYKIPAAGGVGTIFATDPAMSIPNDIDLDAAGNLYVTHDGTIFKATPSGTVTTWKADPLLASAAAQPGPCGTRTSPFPIGANGIVVEANRVFVGNSESGSLIQIPIEAGGIAGAATAISADTAKICNIDGLARDSDGTYLATVFGGAAIVRISADGTKTTTVLAGLPLQGAAGVDVGAFGSSRAIVISSPDFEHGLDGTPATSSPNLVAVPVP